MARRSLRDEMLRGGGARGARRVRRWPLVVAVLGILIVLVVLISLLARVGSDAPDAVPTGPGADTAQPEGSDATGPAPDGTAPDGTAPDAAASDAPETGGSGRDDAAGDGAVVLTGEAAAIRAELDALPIVPGTTDAVYDRGLFGQAWFDEDRNGCDTRNDILGRDLRDPVFKDGTRDCKVLSGVLEDWYSGQEIDFEFGSDTSRLVQIDHIVPLSWAWQHGADAWSDEQRRAFANDPLNLNATKDTENASKGDDGPSQWLPSSDAAQCRYVQRFTAVLSAYPLGIDLRDRAMIRGILDECQSSELFGAFENAP